MINTQKVIIPAIIIGIIAGVILFFLAFNLYPHKHVNINFNGKCYEFLDASYEKYKVLELEKERYIRQLQITAIREPNAIIPIVFSGTNNDVNNFVKENSINITYSKALSNNSNSIDKVITKGTISKDNLKRLIYQFPITITDALNKPVLQSMGIESNSFITPQEGVEISNNVQIFMDKGIKKIIDTSEGVKSAECRTQLTYNDNQ